jgi:hypothetical protein
MPTRVFAGTDDEDDIESLAKSVGVLKTASDDQ